MIWNRKIRAFTLLEVVVVLAITAVLFGLAVLKIADGGRNQTVEQEGKRLKAICEFAMQTAILQSNEIGAMLDDSSYAFVVYEEGQWRALQNNTVLRQRSLPHGIRIRMVAGDGETLARKGASNEINPQVIFYSNGEISPFEIYLTDKYASRSFRLRGHLTGVLELQAEASSSAEPD